MRRRMSVPQRRGDGGDLRRSPEDGEALTDERLPLVRWTRIWIGLGLIVAAIIWIAIDQALGITTTAVSPTPVPSQVRAAPALGTPQTVADRTVNAKLVGQTPEGSGEKVPAGMQELVIAVQVINTGSSPLVVAPRDFQARVGNTIVPGNAYPGHVSQLFTSPLASGATSQGFLSVVVPANAGPGLLSYLPHGSTGVKPLIWRLP